MGGICIFFPFHSPIQHLPAGPLLFLPLLRPQASAGTAPRAFCATLVQKGLGKVIGTMDGLTQEPGEGHGRHWHLPPLPGQASKQVPLGPRGTGLMLQQEGVRLDPRIS